MHKLKWCFFLANAGGVLDAWGAGLFSMPHMITTDKEGSVFVTDVGRHQVCVRSGNAHNMHCVCKGPRYQVMLILKACMSAA